MKKKFNANKVISGTFGSVFVNGDKLANVKSFEAKLTLNYEAVNIAEEPAEKQKYMGYSGSGTMILHKTDTYIGKTVAVGVKSGVLPDIMLVGSLKDPAAAGAERVQLLDVTIDEVTLMKFETNALTEEEVPFKFGDFEYLDMIEG